MIGFRAETGQDLSPLPFGQPFERTRPLTFHFREAVEGTDPDNAQSFFQPAPVLNGGQFQIPLDGLRHRRYRFWESPDLTPGSWELATTLGPLANNGPLVYQKPRAKDRLFIRIDTLLP